VTPWVKRDGTAADSVSSFCSQQLSQQQQESSQRQQSVQLTTAAPRKRQHDGLWGSTPCLLYAVHVSHSQIRQGTNTYHRHIPEIIPSFRIQDRIMSAAHVKAAFVVAERPCCLDSGFLRQREHT
jgi:hypothetical protein